MKTHSKYLLLTLIISFLPFISIFLTPSLPHTSDGGVQIPRMVAFYTAIKDGHIPVRWAGDLNYGYGLPLFNFIYQTPFWISTICIWLGISLVATFKIVLLFSFLLSGIAMFLFAREFTNNERVAFFMTMLYQFAPFRLVEVLTRGAVGGVYAYVFFPFVLWTIVIFIKKSSTNSNKIHTNKMYSFIGTSIFTSLLILSHNSLALVFFGIITLFTLYFAPSIRKKIIVFFSLFIGLGLSSFYWIPALFEHKYTYGDLFMKDLYKQHFPAIQNFFIPNPLNFQSLRVAEISVHWGIIHTGMLILGILFVWKKYTYNHSKHDALFAPKDIVVFSFILIGISLFFMQPISMPLWERISTLRQFQFPWRLLAVVVFSTSLLGALLPFFSWFKNNTFYTLCIGLMICSTMFYWGPTEGYDQIKDEKIFWNYPLNTTYFGETDVIWSAGPAKNYPNSTIEVISGKALVSNINKKTQRQTFAVSVEEDSRLVSNTQYFPGWRVYVDKQKTPIEFQDQNWRGLITFPVPKGNHTVDIIFEETPIRLFADIVSVLTGIFLLIQSIWIKKRKESL